MSVSYYCNRCRRIHDLTGGCPTVVHPAVVSFLTHCLAGGLGLLIGWLLFL